jgi:hypothetical protein
MIRIAMRVRFNTVEDVAKAENVTRQRILRLCNAGRVTGAEKIGGRWVIPNGYSILPKTRGGGPKTFTKINRQEAA